MKALKIFGKFLLALLVLVIIAMFVIPYFYKDKITELAKTELNKQVNAEVNFTDVDLSFFRSFPNVSVGIYGLSVTNPPSDTLLKIYGLQVTAGLFSLFKDDVIEIKSIKIDRPSLALKISKQGETNWDIMKEGEEMEMESDRSSDEFVLLLKKIRLFDGEISYRDEETDLSFYVDNLDAFLSGRFTENRTDLDLELFSKAVSVTYEGIKYLDNTSMEFNAVIDANLSDEIYNLKNNSLYVNGLRLNFEGSVAYVDDDINLMLVYNAPDNSFKQLLSLIPLIYSEDFDKLVTTGQFSMDGFVKGIYSETKMPDFKVHLHTANTEVSYKEMPASLKDIGFDLLVENKGNDLDKTVVKLDNFSAMLGKDKVNLNLYLTKLISDPFIDMKASGVFHLENLKNVFPQESLQSVAGELMADLTIKGNLSSAEQADYKNIVAMGSVICKNVKYNYGDGDYPVELHHAQFNFSPSQIDIIAFDSRINNNKILAEGKMENYLSYYLKDDLFRGNLNISSDKLDLNKLLEPWLLTENSETLERSDTDEDEVTYIPKNIDVLVSLTADSVLYRKMVFADFNSQVHVHEGRVDFENVNSSFLNGLLNLQGFYEAVPESTPHIDFTLSLKDMNIGSAYQNLTLFRQFAPIAEKADGMFNTTLSLSTDLDRQMNPVWTSIVGNGNFKSENIQMNAQDIFNKITDVLKVNVFNNLSTGPVDLSFNLLDGKLYSSPFTVKVDQVQMEIGGWTGFDQQIDYNIGFDIPVDMLGDDVANVVNQYAAEAAKFGITLGDVTSLRPVVGVTGDFHDPEVRLVSMGKSTGGGVKDIVEDKVEEVIDEYAEKANAEAEKIIAEAQKQADSIISAAQLQADQVMQLARQSVKDAKAEAQKQADQLVEEAAKEGPIAELAAKAAATELMNSADTQAGKVLQRAQQEADQIVEAARNQSDRIVQEANEKADRIRR